MTVRQLMDQMLIEFQIKFFLCSAVLLFTNYQPTTMYLKLTEGHWNVLLDFMEHHREFAKGRFSGPTGKTIQRKLWEELAELLNAIGAGSKPVGKWQKTWADIKYTIKKKVALKRKYGGAEVKVLNRLEERVVNILGKTFYEGASVSKCKTTEHGYCKPPQPNIRQIQYVENKISQDTLMGELREIKLELRELNNSMSSIANSLTELVSKK
ncbi:uncharacterized protein LOC126883196 [Diabrotica virgifera virgifera]|uniref:Regulatory protein zeste n=2 Tax=Diabrotica virgifera virgifera TaxID=50390 RepID=A0ABM5K2I8_DIAVI|nr:uncharacterized protein LOC126883196 [Diabrotica virgifera virgifera]